MLYFVAVEMLLFLCACVCMCVLSQCCANADEAYLLDVYNLSHNRTIMGFAHCPNKQQL